MTRIIAVGIYYIDCFWLQEPTVNESADGFRGPLLVASIHGLREDFIWQLGLE